MATELRGRIVVEKVCLEEGSSRSGGLANISLAPSVDRANLELEDHYWLVVTHALIA